MGAEETARAALDKIALAGSELSYLAEGLSSDAWLVEQAGKRVVLRVSKRDDGDEFVREHAVLDALTGPGACVPVPVAGSWEQDDWCGPPFSVTTFIDGEPLVPVDVLLIADDLVRFFDVLHATQPPAGLLTLDRRFDGAPLWPLRRAKLGGHPVEADAATAARIDPLADPVRQALAGPAVLVHSDLHEGNIVRTSGGAAFLDFGCAFVGSALWDFAALAFFLGWPVVERVLHIAGAPSAHEVRLVALSFALYRWEAWSGDEEEARHSAAFIEQTLERLG
jgi:aminoglycoside phosphotransferase (APT) family kinase protein